MADCYQPSLADNQQNEGGAAMPGHADMSRDEMVARIAVLEAFAALAEQNPCTILLLLDLVG
jgi:hypothetical protein